MAVLDNTDYTEIKEISKSNPTSWDVFKTWGLDKATLKATFQAAEDWFVNGFSSTPTTSFTAALEAEAGTVTATQAKWVGKVWFVWRIGQNW